MKKIRDFYRNFLIYKVFEGILFFSIIFFSLKSIMIFFNNFHIEYVSFLFFPFYLLKNRDCLSFKKFINNLEKKKFDNISYINLLFLENTDKKYNFSEELIKKEIIRNKEAIKNKNFKIQIKYLILLSIISILMGLCVSISSLNSKTENIKIIYKIYPENISALYGDTVEIGIDIKNVEKISLNMTFEDTTEVVPLKEDNKIEIKISSSFKYSFSFLGYKTEEYLVNAVKPIDLQDILFTIKYPKYLERADEKIYKRNIELLKGSFFVINPIWNKSLDTYEIIFDNKDENKSCVYNKNIFKLEQNINYSISAFDKYSEYRSPVYSIKALEDKNPYIKIIRPSIKNVVIQDSSLYIKYLARDDFMLDNFLIEFNSKENKRSIKKGVYSQKEIIDELNFDIEQDGTVEIKVFDKKGNSYSEYISVSIMNKDKALKKILSKMRELDKDLNKDIKKIKETDAEKKNKIEKIFMKGEIDNEDRKVLKDYSDKTQSSIKDLKDLDQELKKLEDLAKSQELSKKINKKLNSLRNMINQLVNSELKKKLENINELNSKKKLSHSDYNKFNNELKLKKMLEELDNTMKLFEKAKKENERMIILEYLKEIRDDLFSLKIFVSKNYKKEFGFLKGVKIRYQSIIDSFNSIKEYIEADKEELEELSLQFNNSLKMIFKDKTHFLNAQNIIIEKIDKIIEENQKKISEQQQKEKDKVSALLKTIYSDNLFILKNLNNISKEYFPGVTINNFGQEILKNEELIKKIKNDLKELLKLSFILESSIFKLYEDTSLYQRNFFEKGKEGYNVSSYLNMSSRNIMNIGLKIIKAMNKLNDMQQASALQEMLERIEEMNRMQGKLGKELMELLSGEETMQSMLEQFSQMQKSIREQMEGLASQYMDEQLNGIAQKMKELEEQMLKENPNVKEIIQNQKKVREMFKKKLIHLTDKLNKKEYKSNTFDQKDPVSDQKETYSGEINKSYDFNIPEDFPDIPENIKKLVEDYMNAID